jgi:Ca2+-binding EF-hand superfamily protein
LVAEWEYTNNQASIPRLFSYALQENISADEVYELEDVFALFYRPMSRQDFVELQDLEDIMRHNPRLNQKDVWSYISAEKHGPGKFYAHIHKNIQVPNF